MTVAIVFDPLAPPPVAIGIALIVGLGAAALALRASFVGGAARLAAAFFLAMLALNPQIKQETRTPQPDIALIVVDKSGSQSLDGRAAATDAAVSALKKRLAALSDVEIRETEITGENETPLVAGVESALADAPRGRLGAVFIVTDGAASDTADAPHLTADAPAHLLLTGRPGEFDRKLTIVSAPHYGVVKETATVRFRVDDLGPDQKPAANAGRAAEVVLKIDGEEVARQNVAVGAEAAFETPLPHPGRLIVELAAAPVAGELTTRNNTAVLDIAAIRDRLRVLLISGAPHPGERVWRNLLKSDPSVDLVHFTILRPYEKSGFFERQDELALIQFPQDELFSQKLSAFDLVIFDRYDFPGVITEAQFANIARYVREGGAVLVSTGAEFAGVRALESPLNFASILPATPLGGAREGPFRPKLSADGRRHPVTTALPDQDFWGRWLRYIPALQRSGRAVLAAPGDAPLLILDRVGDGRVGLLLSDQVWLWARGFDGGGPHAELLRRVAHWLMKEPELEEEQLALADDGGDLVIRRRSLSDAPGPVSLERPDGVTTEITLAETAAETAPGRFEARLPKALKGLYRARAQGLFAVGAVGLAAPPEFQSVVSDRAPLAPFVAKTHGRIFTLRQGAGVATPALRRVSPGPGPRGGLDWAGVLSRHAYRVDAVRQRPLASPAVWLALVAAALVLAWAGESRLTTKVREKIYDSA